MSCTPMGRLFACAAAAAFCGTAVPADAGLFYNETFSYEDGTLTAESGGNWTAHSGAGNKPIQVSSGQISLEQSGGSGEDVNRLTGATMGEGDVWFAAFDVTVTESAAEHYFAHFSAGSGNFQGRVHVTAPGALGGEFTLALSGDGSLDTDGDAIWGSSLAFGTTYRVVTSYDYDSGTAQMWVDPTTQASTSISATDGAAESEIDTYAFRQSSPASTVVEVIDNLCVAMSFDEALYCVPEPSSLALMLLVGVGSLGMGRRRRAC